MFKILEINNIKLEDKEIDGADTNQNVYEWIYDRIKEVQNGHES